MEVIDRTPVEVAEQALEDARSRLNALEQEKAGMPARLRAAAVAADASAITAAKTRQDQLDGEIVAQQVSVLQLRDALLEAKIQAENEAEEALRPQIEDAQRRNGEAMDAYHQALRDFNLLHINLQGHQLSRQRFGQERAEGRQELEELLAKLSGAPPPQSQAQAYLPGYGLPVIDNAAVDAGVAARLAPPDAS